VTPDQVDGLGVALNEADWHDLSVDGDTVSALLTVLARDEDGDEVADPRRTLRLSGCARLAASYGPVLPDRPNGDPLPLDLEGLRGVLHRSGGTPIYGWEFVDAHDVEECQHTRFLCIDDPLLEVFEAAPPARTGVGYRGDAGAEREAIGVYTPVAAVVGGVLKPWEDVNVNIDQPRGDV